MNQLNLQAIQMYQVDAFSNKVFQGNPAAICIMEGELPDAVMQSIAAENNLAETAFVWKRNGHYKIRWCTPTIEVDLCGHATLASAYVLFEKYGILEKTIRFDSRSGDLFVTKSEDGKLYLDFPVDQIKDVETPSGLIDALGTEVLNCIKGKTDYLVEIGSESLLRSISPDFHEISKLNSRGLIVTAPGDKVDFVSRCFFPQSGILEDPVTGSAHTTLTPYWATKLEKSVFLARQISSRGGDLTCELKGDRVLIGGNAVLFFEGKIFV